MTSLRHNPVADAGAAPGAARSVEDTALDAARESILDVGWRRTTLTDVARRAGVSRMTLYRRWPEMNALLGDLMTREWTALVALPSTTPGAALHRSEIVAAVVATVAALRQNPLFRRIVELDGDRLLPYLLERPGRSQEHLLDLLGAVIASAQASGSIRAGEPAVLARVVLLTAHGFTLSAHTMTTGAAGAVTEEAGLAALDAELERLLDQGLAP